VDPDSMTCGSGSRDKKVKKKMGTGTFSKFFPIFIKKNVSSKFLSWIRNRIGSGFNDLSGSWSISGLSY
jgi:hypothetical protein